MSVAVRRALYGKMSGDTTLAAMLNQSPPTGVTKSIYFEVAPSGAEPPYVIYSKSAGTPRYAIGARAYDDEVWTIKGVAREDPDAADGIASRLDVLLTDGTVSISGKTQLYLRRESDLNYAEDSDGRVYRHSGSDFRLIVRNS